MWPLNQLYLVDWYFGQLEANKWKVRLLCKDCLGLLAYRLSSAFWHTPILWFYICLEKIWWPFRLPKSTWMYCELLDAFLPPLVSSSWVSCQFQFHIRHYLRAIQNLSNFTGSGSSALDSSTTAIDKVSSQDDAGDTQVGATLESRSTCVRRHYPLSFLDCYWVISTLRARRTPGPCSSNLLVYHCTPHSTYLQSTWNFTSYSNFW